MTKISEIAPGLTQYKDPDSQQMEESGLFDRLKCRFWNKNLERKKGRNSSEGMYLQYLSPILNGCICPDKML